MQFNPRRRAGRARLRAVKLFTVTMAVFLGPTALVMALSSVVALTLASAARTRSRQHRAARRPARPAYRTGSAPARPYLVAA
jgi:hypothetical protein